MSKTYSIKRAKALHQHWTNKSGILKPKVQFKTLDEALEYINKNKLKHRYHPYICSDCGMWHIGHNKK